MKRRRTTVKYGRISKEEIKDIRFLLEENNSLQEIAEMYGIPVVVLQQRLDYDSRVTSNKTPVNKD